MPLSGTNRELSGRALANRARTGPKLRANAAGEVSGCRVCKSIRLPTDCVRSCWTLLTEHASLVGSHERLPGSSEVLESIIGKYKTLQGEQGQFGTTSMLLSIGSVIGRITLEGIRIALQTVKETSLKTWEQTNLGSTIQSQRKKAFPNPKRGTKTGSRQLVFT